HHPYTHLNHTRSLHDALPIFPGPTDGNLVLRLGPIGYSVRRAERGHAQLRPGHRVHPVDPGLPRGLLHHRAEVPRPMALLLPVLDRKSTRLNSSHVSISYAVF